MLGLDNVFRNIPGLNVISNISDIVNAVRTGDFGALLNAASQLALTYATGGAGALFGQLTPMVNTFGSSMMADAIAGKLGVEAGLAAIQLVGQQMGLSQSSIDAAQGAFASQMGDHSTAREEFAEAGMYRKGTLFDRGDRLTGQEKAQANDFLSMVKNMASGVIAGPNPTPVSLGQAQGLVNNSFGAMMGLFVSMLQGMAEESVRGSGEGGSLAARGGAGGAGGGAPNAAAAPANGTVDLPVSGAASGNQASGVASDGGGGGSILMKIAVALGRAMDDKMEKMAEKSDAIGELDDDDQKGYGELTGEMTALGQELKMLTEALNNTLKSIGEAGSSLARKG